MTQRITQAELMSEVADLARARVDWHTHSYDEWRSRLVLDLYDERRKSADLEVELAKAQEAINELRS